MLDLHVLSYNTNQEWETHCRRTLTVATKAAGFPVSVHWLAGEHGHIGRGRAAGYACGSHPYVTYVDNDDYLLPDALNALGDSIRSGAWRAVFAGELVLSNGYAGMGKVGHHLCVYRRDALIDHSAWVVCGDLAQAEHVRTMPLIRLEHRGYVHRVYESGGRKLRRQHLDELKRAHG